MTVARRFWDVLKGLLDPRWLLDLMRDQRPIPLKEDRIPVSASGRPDAQH